MKFVVIKSNLKEGLFLVERASGDHTGLPILKNVLISVKQNKITLTATNLEIATTSFVLGKVIEEGALTIPINFLIGIINNLQNERLNFEKKGNELEVTTDNYHATIQGLPADDFPIIPKIKNTQESLIIKGSALRDALVQTVVSAQFSELRPELSSVLLIFSIDTLKLIATDSFRLSEKTLLKSQFQSNYITPIKILIPLKVGQELLRIIKDEDVVGLYYDKNQILFKTERFECVSRLIDGTFPDYEMIIPKTFDAEIVLNREECINALKVVGVFSNRASEVRLKTSDSKKNIEIFSLEQGVGENKYLLPIKIKGESIEINFNWKYLIEGLRVLNSKEVCLAVNKENKPAIIKSPTDASYFYVLMPLLKT